jgi:hypothetical protein
VWNWNKVRLNGRTHREIPYNKQKMLAQITIGQRCATMTVSLPPLPEGWRDDVVYMLHDFLEDAGLAQTLCALEQETGYAPARHPPTRTAPQIHHSDSNFPPLHAPTRRPMLTRHLIRTSQAPRSRRG